MLLLHETVASIPFFMQILWNSHKHYYIHEENHEMLQIRGLPCRIVSHHRNALFSFLVNKKCHLLTTNHKNIFKSQMNKEGK